MEFRTWLITYQAKGNYGYDQVRALVQLHHLISPEKWVKNASHSECELIYLSAFEIETQLSNFDFTLLSSVIR